MPEFGLNDLPLQNKIDFIKSETNKNNLMQEDIEAAIAHRKIARLHSFCVIALTIIEIPALIIIAYKMLGY